MVETFFDAPAVLVAKRDGPGRKLHFVGEVGVSIVIARVLTDDAAERFPIGVARQGVADDALITIILGVGLIARQRSHRAIAFLADDEADAVALETGPGGAINASFGLDGADFLTFDGLKAEGLHKQSLNDSGIVVPSFAIPGTAEVEVDHVVTAQIDVKEVTSSFSAKVSFASGLGGVEAGRFLIVTVSGKEVSCRAS